MSSTASNYDLRMLTNGMIVAALSAVLASIAFLPAILRTPKSLISLPSFLIVTLAYGGMMFASSYVEEEHQFWYWMTSGWLMYLSNQK